MSSTDSFGFNNSSLNNDDDNYRQLVHYTKNRPKPASYHRNQYIKKKIFQENVDSIAEEIENETNFDRKSIDIKSIDLSSGLEIPVSNPQFKKTVQVI
jgi:hypothetical protein